MDSFNTISTERIITLAQINTTAFTPLNGPLMEEV